jgi:hypothetical protein
MRNKKIIIAGILIIVGGLGITYSNKLPFHENISSVPFDFTFKFGPGSTKNTLDTFTNTFTKDMVIDAPITTPLTLTTEELRNIQQRINVLPSFETPPNRDPVILIAPCSTYDLFFSQNGERHHLTWDCGNANGTPELEALSTYIQSIVTSKEEYKTLPEPQGGYF